MLKGFFMFTFVALFCVGARAGWVSTLQRTGQLYNENIMIDTLNDISVTLNKIYALLEKQTRMLNQLQPEMTRQHKIMIKDKQMSHFFF